MSKKVQIPLQLDEDTDSHGLIAHVNGTQQGPNGFLNDSSSTLRKIRSLEQIQQLKKQAKTGLAIQSKHPTLHVTLISPVNRATESGKSPVFVNTTTYTSDRSAGLKPGTTEKPDKRNTTRPHMLPSVDDLIKQLDGKDEEISKLQRENQSLQSTVRQLQREIHQMAVKENELAKVFGSTGFVGTAPNLQGNTTSRQRKPKLKLSKMSPSSHMMSTMTSTINSSQKNLSPRKEKLLSIHNLNNKEAVEMLSIDRHKTLEDIYRKTHSSIKSIASFRANGPNQANNIDQYSISSKQLTTPLLNALISPKNGPADSGTDVPVLMDLQSKGSFYPSEDVELTGQEPCDSLAKLKSRLVRVLTGYKNQVETLRAANDRR